MGCLFALMAGLLPAPGPVHPVDREAGQDRRRLRHLPPARARHHLSALRHPDVRPALHPRPGPVRMGLVLGRHRRPPRHRALGRRRHPAQSDPWPAPHGYLRKHSVLLFRPRSAASQDALGVPSPPPRSFRRVGYFRHSPRLSAPPEGTPGQTVSSCSRTPTVTRRMPVSPWPWPPAHPHHRQAYQRIT